MIYIGTGMPDVLVAGVVSVTGSIAIGSSLDGLWARSCGVGLLMGDEGSAYTMGSLAALHTITQAADGRGQATCLTSLILETWNLPDISSLVGRIYQQWARHPRIANLGLVLRRAVSEGDAIALDIQAQVSGDPAKMATAVVRQLGLHVTLHSGVSCDLGGGVQIYNDAVMQVLIESARWENIILEIVVKVSEPARRVVRLAFRAVRPYYG